ncbi:MAG: pyridoxamine 5'-phosphate oxidase family protein [Halobacteriota archaeon]
MTSFEDCTQFANEHKICWVSTVEGNRPHVRIQALWFADKSGFYFSTLKTKNVYRQLSENPHIEVCFYAPPKRPFRQEGSRDMGTMMRVSGQITFLDNERLMERLLNDRPILRPNADKQAIFCIKAGEAWFWTAKDDNHENEIERIRF